VDSSAVPDRKAITIRNDFIKNRIAILKIMVFTKGFISKNI
jgi:hypothetical protein